MVGCMHTYSITYSMEQSPSWEANRSAASQEPATSSPHTYTSRRSILILSSHPRLGLPSGLFPSGFPTKTLYTPLLSPTRATCPAHLILLDFITRTILGEEYRLFCSSLCNFLHSPVTSSVLGPIFSSTPYSQTPSARVHPLMSATTFLDII